jgi:hypothetical protein
MLRDLRHHPHTHPIAATFMPFCTCGCRAQVTYATKICHLSGKGKATLRSRVAAENEWLTQNTSLHHLPKKRSHSTSGQNHSRTRRKAGQVEVEGGPGIIHADADLMEALPEPVAGQSPLTFRADADPLPELVAGQISPTFHAAADPFPDPVAGQVPPTLHADADFMEVPPKPASDQVPQRLHADADANLEDSFPEPDVISECEDRLRGIMEERWGNDVLNEGFGEAAADSSEDDEGAPTDLGSEGDDDDSAPFAESNVAGISAQDMLREGFECEAALMG